MKTARGSATKTVKLLRALGAAALFLSSSGMALSATTTVGFNPSESNVNVGQIFTVDIVGSNFTALDDYPELAGGVIDLGFNTSGNVLAIESLVVTDPPVVVNSAIFDFLPDGGGPETGSPYPTTWPGIAFDTFANDPATGDFKIATISFRAVAPGTTSLVILPSSQFFSSTAQIFPITPNGTVNVVPVPAAVWLFGTGLLGLIGIARRKTS
jgi:hypothetical protein